MNTITPCLWFDGNAEEAANLYISLLPDSRIDAIQRSPSDHSSGMAGNVITVEFTFMGRPFVGLNGGSFFKFNEAISPQMRVRQSKQTTFAKSWTHCVTLGDRFVRWLLCPPQVFGKSPSSSC
jgi:predicted 3-demethylubiquinone-9 3-methyltransferase (glyoxalase superfamily)